MLREITGFRWYQHVSSAIQFLINLPLDDFSGDWWLLPRPIISLELQNDDFLILTFFLHSLPLIICFLPYQLFGCPVDIFHQKSKITAWWSLSISRIVSRCSLLLLLSTSNIMNEFFWSIIIHLRIYKKYWKSFNSS